MVNTLSSFGVEVKILANQSSIFEAYKKGMDLCDAKDGDIIILCHDDIELLDSKEEFISKLAICVQPRTGIVGPAGTTNLGNDAVWWNQERWQSGYHRGLVHHVQKDKETNEQSFLRAQSQDKIVLSPTHYGPYGQVVALDGLFLAATKKVWDIVGLDKPKYYEGNWDFYDIHYTTTAHLKGYKNLAIPIKIVHHSSGELVGRDSWHDNRQAFIRNSILPITC